MLVIILWLSIFLEILLMSYIIIQFIISNVRSSFYIPLESVSFICIVQFILSFIFVFILYIITFDYFVFVFSKPMRYRPNDTIKEQNKNYLFFIFCYFSSLYSIFYYIIVCFYCFVNGLKKKKKLKPQLDSHIKTYTFTKQKIVLLFIDQIYVCIISLPSFLIYECFNI